MSKTLKFNSIINFMLFLYILSIYIFTYRQGYNNISNLIALILIGLVWFNNLIIKKKVVINSFLITYILFMVICLLSSVYAIDSTTVITKVKTLFSIFIWMFTLINYIDSLDKLQKLMKYFVYSGFAASVYILIISDFSNLTRFGSELGNVNAIGMILVISSTFCFYFIIEKRQYLYIAIFLVNAIVIFLTGSRKALLLLVFTLLVILYSKGEGKIGKKVVTLVMSALIVLLVLYLIFNNPMLYQIIGKRMENLFEFALGEGTKEGSINERYLMTQLGLEWFKRRPLTGYGIGNYQFLLNNSIIGRITYSHNNIIELLVGVGIFGTIVYYIAQIVVIKDLYITSKKTNKPLTFTLIAIILGYILMSVGLVYYDAKHISIILAVGSIIQTLDKNKNFQVMV